MEIGNLIWLLEWERVWEERVGGERLSRAHIEAAVDRNLMALVGEVVGVDIVEGCGNGGIRYSHSEKLVQELKGREERRAQARLG